MGKYWFGYMLALVANKKLVWKFIIALSHNRIVRICFKVHLYFKVQQNVRDVLVRRLSWFHIPVGFISSHLHSSLLPVV